MQPAGAPVGDRHVIVDPDEIDIRAGPERIEMEIDIVRAVVGPEVRVFAPVRGVADLASGPHDRLHVGGERGHVRDRREI